MMANLNNKTPQQLNDEYFFTFANTRGSIGMLKISCASLFILCIDLFFSLNIATGVKKIDIINDYTSIILICFLVFSFICFFISFSKRLIYLRQQLTSIMLAGLIIISAISLVIMGYYIASIQDGVTISEQNYLNSFKPKLFIIIIFLVWFITIFYNIHWLQKNLKQGFSENRAKLNYKAKESVYNSKALWIIFGLTITAGIITQKINFIFGLGLAILMIIAFSRLIIELIYLVFLKIKDKKYWELIPEKEKLTKKEKQRRYKKIFKWMNVSLSILFLCVIPQIIEKYHIGTMSIK